MSETDTKAQVEQEVGADFGKSVLLILGVTALVTWFGGIGLSRGFGFHVPFVDGWVILLAGLVMVRMVTATIAGSWFNVKLMAAPKVAAAEYVGIAAASAMVQAEANGNLDKLLAEWKASAEAKPE